jgi:uncharacterized protein YjbI with pentapeptide repeats
MSMAGPFFARSAAGLAAVVTVTLGAVVFAAGPAGALTGKVSCPAVNSGTGFVSPFPKAGVDWSGCNLSHADLQYAVLTKANLSKANLTGANLEEASAKSADLSKANLTDAAIDSVSAQDANLSGANLTGASISLGDGQVSDLTGANLSGAVLTGAYLNYALLTDTDLVKADLENASLEYSDLGGADAQDADLTGANLESATAGANFTGASLSNADLTDTSLNGADLGDSDLGTATMDDTSSGGVSGTPASLPASWSLAAGFLLGPFAGLDNADLAGANLGSPDLQDAYLQQADLSGAVLGSADLQDADLDQADLAGTVLAGVNLAGAVTTGLTGTPASLPPNWMVVDGYLVGPAANDASADLAGANLAGADLDGTSLVGANLTGADLSGSTLAETSFSGSTLTDADLNGAVASTAGFNNVTSGGITGTPASLPAPDSLYHGYLVAVGAQLAGADLSGADLTGDELEGVNLTGANLSNTNLAGVSLTNALLTNADLDNADLSGASRDLWGVRSGSVTGTPAAIATGWSLADGYLLGQDAYLEHASLASADLSGVNLLDADLQYATLTGASLAGDTMTDSELYQADLTGANLTGSNLSDSRAEFANFSNATLAGANFTSAELTSANLTGATGGASATWTSATWYGTTCPDGSSSNAYTDGCFSALDTTPPQAAPTVSGTLGNDGWYISPVAVNWNWTDNGTVNSQDCTQQTGAYSDGDPATVTATCTDLAGNTGHASVQVKLDWAGPSVTVTGVRKSGVYALGKVPAAGCRTTDISGVDRPARVTVTGSGRLGSGSATCTGAISVAGTDQAAPVRDWYHVAYGFDRFSSPRSGGTIARSAHRFAVWFRLAGANGGALSSSVSLALGNKDALILTMTGPGISARQANCSWQSPEHAFRCELTIPSRVRPGKNERYSLTVLEQVGSAFDAAPARDKVASTEVIHFS